jgi:hypothetical protein
MPRAQVSKLGMERTKQHVKLDHKYIGTCHRGVVDMSRDIVESRKGLQA